MTPLIRVALAFASLITLTAAEQAAQRVPRPSDPLSPGRINDQFLDTRVTAGLNLRWLAEPSLAGLAVVPGFGLQVAVSRRTWTSIDALWLDWQYGTSRARLDDDTKQRLTVQSYRGGFDLRFSDSVWMPYAALGAGVSTWTLREGSTQGSDWSWEVSAQARWRWQLDPSLHLGAVLGAAAGPPINIFNKEYAHVSLEASIGIGYAY